MRKPGYNLHKASGRARTHINGKNHWLGKYGSRESKRKYRELIRQWEAEQNALAAGMRPDLTVAELCERFEPHLHDHYRKNGKPTSEVSCFQSAIRVLVEVHGDTNVADFGPLALKQVRSEMIELGWVRTSINKQVGRIRRIFKWGIGEELLRPEILTALEAVPGLQAGRTDAVESDAVRPVEESVVNAALPYLVPTVVAMVQLQLLTGMRPGEVLNMHADELETWGEVWEYRPSSHKTEHHNKQRVIYLGPQAQAIIQPYLRDCGYLFRPTGNNWGLDHDRPYHRDAYRNMIQRACVKADVEVFHPHRLRHTAATRLRQQVGIEGTKNILGHATISMAEVYAERDDTQVREIAKNYG
ncbi:Tyrosine recombinase XerD [Symmachiella macrocystis]|uniref:Tyrosine recombinase XerD n=1 Tax=Symmachiella macrocystis TaxID=2527985 RepID=A0A5C6BA32_9PLAN|nr:tyrosine-type recombinase/integrase [Symmachiella macrocystis]TWU08840.1 Tyrosine recombinase XerD [Symmachiella macrocystis]